MVRAPAEEMLGKGSAVEAKFASRYRKQITRIREGMALLKGRYPETGALRRGAGLVLRSGYYAE